MDYNQLPDVVLDKIYIVRTDIENRITYVSDGLCKLTGYTRDELIGDSPAVFGDHEAIRGPIKELWDSLENDGHWEGILRNRKKDGSIYYQNTNIVKEYDKYNNHIGYFAINTDIGSSIANPSQFIFESNFFDIFFSSETDIMAVCLCKSDDNPRPRLLEISNKLLDLLEVSKEFILENKYDFTSILSKESEYYNKQELLIEDYKNGKEIFVTIDSLRNHRKYICKVNISDFKYQGHNARIFKLVDLTKEIETSKKLRELDQSKNQFLANFSHEIRTPLNATIGFVELMKDQTNDQMMMEYLNIVLDNSKHLLDMMNDVIDFTSVDNNKIEIVQREFSPKDIQSTIEVFYAKSLEKEIDFTIFLSPQLPERMTQDILRIKQVISNLLSNALKFTDYGGKIVVDVYNTKERLTITVEDSGIGMNEAQVVKIFDPFQQASTDTEVRYGGTGLGLSVVKKIIEKMGGEINVDSIPDTGTKFKIDLPLANYIEKTLVAKLNLENIYIFVPSFSKDKLNILKRYVRHFTGAKISVRKKLYEDLKENDIAIIFKDDIEMDKLEELTFKHKVILLKRFNDIMVSTDFNEANLQEINLPLIGSKLYDALYSLIHNKLLVKNIDSNKLEADISLMGKVMFAEDMQANITLIESLLTKFPKLDYTIARNGQEALDYYLESVENDDKFNMIFLDENMPLLSGSAVAEKIRNFEKKNNFKRLPIIALTANRYGNKDDNALIYMDEYISKPMDIKELFSILLKYTSKESFETEFISKSEKLMKLKELRDLFINDDENLLDFIESLNNILRITDLMELKNAIINKDKVSFNKFYNQIIKNIRKENK